MTVFEAFLAVAVVFVLLGAHQAVTRALSILSDHLERFQGKLDVLVTAQVEYNRMLDGILAKLL